MSRLFLGNIPNLATEANIQEWIQSEGFMVESVDIIRDRLTGNPRGFCFASLLDPKQVNDAVSALNGKRMSGRPITVNHAVPLSKDGVNPNSRPTPGGS
jgi:RNA recognition motif-containing protein